MPVRDARQANVYPDGVELVFIDDPRDFSNPVYPIWLILLANKLQTPDAPLDIYSLLCGQPREQDSLSMRTFNMVALDYTRYTCNGVTGTPADACNHSGTTCTDISITTSP